MSRIGMIDDGIDLRHPGLAGADVIERFYGGATKGIIHHIYDL